MYWRPLAIATVVTVIACLATAAADEQHSDGTNLQGDIPPCVVVDPSRVPPIYEVPCENMSAPQNGST